MTAYEDVFFDEQYVDDDTQDVVCRMCHEDCPLSCMKDGLCPGCSSLCAAAPVQEDAYTRRAHLVNLTRTAFLLWSDACDLVVSRENALRPSRDCIEEAHLLAQHRYRKYNLLESRLADETRLDKFSVFNEINSYPDCTRLLTRNL